MASIFILKDLTTVQKKLQVLKLNHLKSDFDAVLQRLIDALSAIA